MRWGRVYRCWGCGRWMMIDGIAGNGMLGTKRDALCISTAAG